MGRYRRLKREDVVLVWQRLEDAFLAARNGKEVEQILLAILTPDERLKIGRRLQVAKMLREGRGYEDIMRELSVGKNTVALVARRLDQYPEGYGLIGKRQRTADREYQDKAYRKHGGSKLLLKPKRRTGFKRGDVERK